MDEKIILETKNITKAYKDNVVINNVSMHVNKGDIYGFVGKNGAGKTTIIKMILGLTKVDQGTIEIFGSEENDKNVKKIGCVVEEPALYKGMTAYENLEAYGRMIGLKDKEKIIEVLKLTGLNNTQKKKAGNFSMGMRQRLAIAMALLGKPQILVLDEPINGLDPGGIKEIRNLLLKLNQEEKITIIISSHILNELSKIATRYGIINKGCLVEELTREELMEKKNKALNGEENILEDYFMELLKAEREK